MAATVRLMRTGKKNRAFYRIVVIDKRKNRNSRYIESLGTYDPLTNPATIKMDQKKIDHWISMGALVSEGLLKLFKQQKKLKRG